MEVQEHCIYRVPSRIREVKPEAYTPRMVLIGPLHRSIKSVDAKTSSNPWLMKKDYNMMEGLKDTYFSSYIKRVGQDTIEAMRKTIEDEEKNIRASYEEPTELIPSNYFVDLILQDAVFIMEFILRDMGHHEYSDDKIVNHPVRALMVRHDLILLENQLPYFIFKRLFGSSMMELHVHETLDEFILRFFRLKIQGNTNFKHFTDMFRCVYEESLDHIPKHIKKNRFKWSITELMTNADNLSQAGVNFKASGRSVFPNYDLARSLRTPTFHPRSNQHHFVRSMTVVPKTYRPRLVRKATFMPMSNQPIKRKGVEYLSLQVEFEKGILTMPCFRANEASDILLRNIIAFENCHGAVTIPFTSNYIHFLNFLITSNKDVQLLTEEGVVTNPMGQPSYVVDMLNKLQVGVNEGSSSQYYDVAKNLRAHYKSRRKRRSATLKKVYFSDLWTGTATAAAVALLLLTLIGTVASVIQAYKSF